MTIMATITTGSPDHFIECNRASNNISQTTMDITLPTEDLEKLDDNVRKKKVAKVLFEQKMVQSAKGHEISHG